MLEQLLFKEETKIKVIALISISGLITNVLGYFNAWFGNNSLFLVSLTSLALSYPVIKYIILCSTEELTQRINAHDLMSRHGRELVILWSIFLGVTIGFILVAIEFKPDFTQQQLFVQSITGQVTATGASFVSILLNNLKVGFLTMGISGLVFSGLIFVLVWNASIIAYYLSTLGGKAVSTSFLLLGHGLLEIGGYIMLGIAGSFIGLMLERKWNKQLVISNAFFKDMFLFVGSGVLLILLGAILESL